MKSALALLLCFALTLPVWAQKKSSHASAPALQGQCKTCHACNQPTKANPCLSPCPRHDFGIVRRSVTEGPERILMATLTPRSGKRVYPPVAFSHRVHAEMADLGGGCAMCHHYNPTGPIVSCNTCHEEQRKRADVSRPDLKAAYHRQCMECHRSWSHKSDCAQCHNRPSAPSKSAASVHPKTTVPEKVVKTTSYAKGRIVTFQHMQHVSLYRIECTSCHTNESCARCHDVRKPSPSAIRSVVEVHRPCAKCHVTTSNCGFCHTDTPQGPFDHGTRTGWTLSRPHAALACQSCHKTRSSFKGLSRECITCHRGWDATTFKHEVTGLVLDEFHASFSCSDCHPKGDYASKACAGCHEDKSWPKHLPGRVVSKSASRPRPSRGR